MYQPLETIDTTEGSYYQANKSFTMPSQEYKSFLTLQGCSQYYRMACYLRSRDDDTKLSRLFYDCTKNAENAESEESCLLSQFPAHTLSAAVSHVS